MRSSKQYDDHYVNQTSILAEDAEVTEAVEAPGEAEVRMVTVNKQSLVDDAFTATAIPNSELLIITLPTQLPVIVTTTNLDSLIFVGIAS